MHSVQFAALYTVQHGLAGNAEFDGGFEHGQIAGWRVFDKACAQLIGDPYLPGRARSDLFASDEAVIEPAMNGRGGDAEDLGGFPDRDQRPLGQVGFGLVSRDFPVPAQAAHVASGESFAGGCFPALTVEDASNDIVGVVGGQTAEKRDGVFVSAQAWKTEAGPVQIDRRDGAAVPAQSEVGVTFNALDVNEDFIQKSAAAVPCGRGRSWRGGAPHLGKIGAESLDALELLGTDETQLGLFPAAQFGFGGGETLQMVFPFGFESARDESILGLDQTEAAFGALGLVTSAFDLQAPLVQSGVMVEQGLLSHSRGRVQGLWRNRIEKGVGDGLVDGPGANVEAVHATPMDDVFAGAVIARRGVAARVVGSEPAAAMPTTGQALQQRRTLSHSASALMGPGTGVGTEPCLVGQERRPIDKAGMVFRDKDSPLVDGQAAGPFPDSAVCIDVALASRFTVGVSASIHRIGQDVVDCGVGGRGPADRAVGTVSAGEGQVLGAEPEPDPPGRTVLGEGVEQGADGASNGFIGIEQHLPIGLAPEETDGQAAAQFAAGGFVANAAVQAGANDVQLGFAHRALETEQESIVERPRMIHPVVVANERIGQAAQFQQTIPIGVVARQA